MVCNLLSHIPCGKQVALQEGNEWEYDLIHDDTEVKLTGIRLACHNTAILPILIPSHGHANMYPQHIAFRNLLSTSVHEI